jgi:hypothetical protein
MHGIVWYIGMVHCGMEWCSMLVWYGNVYWCSILIWYCYGILVLYYWYGIVWYSILVWCSILAWYNIDGMEWYTNMVMYLKIYSAMWRNEVCFGTQDLGLINCGKQN